MSGRAAISAAFSALMFLRPICQLPSSRWACKIWLRINISAMPKMVVTRNTDRIMQRMDIRFCFRCTFAEMGIRSRKCFIRFPSQVRQHAVRHLENTIHGSGQVSVVGDHQNGLLIVPGRLGQQLHDIAAVLAV